MKKRILTTLLALTMACGTLLPVSAAYAEEPPAQTTPEAEATTPTEEPAAATAETAQTPAPEPTAEAAPTPEPSATLEEAASDVFAAAASGKCGPDLQWSYAGGVLTISGNGNMYDYPVYNVPASPKCMPWYAYTSQITTLNIAEGVTSLGACAFWGCTNLKTLVTPASLQTMGYAAFGDCTGLEEITLKAGAIGESAFIRCSALKTVTIGGGVKALGISAFENCTALQTVNISDLVAWCAIDFGGYLANPVEYTNRLTLNGSDITTLNVPAGVTKISDYAFRNLKKLTAVTIPDSVKTIGEYAFYDCSSLERVDLQGAGLNVIGACAFDSCSSLRDITIPDSVTYIGSMAFSWAPIHLAKVNQGVIASGAFKGCGNIGTITLGAGVTRIGDGAFQECNGLSTVEYGGSAQQWGSILIGTENEKLINATIHYNGSGTATPRPDLSTLVPGATVKFGIYEQDNNTANGSEPVEWTVLDVQGGKALLLTNDVLDFERYYPNEETDVTWENCSLRGWLNNDFMNRAFTTAEQSSIAATTLPGDNNLIYGTNGGNATTDKVFLLSATEAQKYLTNEDLRMAVGTAAALKDNGDSALRNKSMNSSYWWLRTPGMFTYGAAYIHYTGSIRYDGMAVANVIGGVRPAIWVDTGALKVEESAVGQFVSRLYKVCLNRDPDAAGKADWINRLNIGKETGTSAAYGFVFSDEFKNKNLCNEDYVKQLYQAFMGREYDQSGLDYWVNRLVTGTKREEVFNGFAMSKEFRAICDSYGIKLGEAIGIPQYGTVPTGPCSVDGKEDGVTGFVKRMYKVALDRDADAAGLKDWTNRLWSHKASGTDIGNGFIFSTEFKNKNYGNADYVERLYQAFMGRASDAAGKADWVGRLNKGASREDVFHGFAASQEFTNICNSYGIVRG